MLTLLRESRDPILSNNLSERSEERLYREIKEAKMNLSFTMTTNSGRIIRVKENTLDEWNGKEWIVIEDYRPTDADLLHEYNEGMISYEELPYHLQDQLRDEYLWEQADAMYDMMQEEGL
jgi:hypothetical protein